MGELIGKVVESTLYYVPKDEFDRVRTLNEASAVEKTAIFADMCRLNTLYMIARAGSGHIGSSFSSLDVVSWLYLNAAQRTTTSISRRRATMRPASTRC